MNVSADGRYLVAAYGDGTIRWHRPEDGSELLAFYPFADRRNWVVWEPGGRFASTPGARGALRWHVNRGWDEIPLRLPAHEIKNSSRPEVIKRVLSEGGTMQAVYAAEEIERKADLRRLTGLNVGPGAQLHALTIGVSEYNSDTGLSLNWADEDAYDLAAALDSQTDGWPYERGFITALRDEEATAGNILKNIARIWDRMKANAHPDNLAVISFSGHGAVLGEGVGRGFYLLPHDFRRDSEIGMRRSGIAAADLRQAIAEVAQHGRVLLLLDACRSGAMSGDELHVNDAGLLMQQIAMRNVSILTSSSGEEISFEQDHLRNGAFTEVVLEAIGHAGDADRDGMVSLTEFTSYIVANVRALTSGQQTPTLETRFEGNLFASGG